MSNNPQSKNYFFVVVLAIVIALFFPERVQRYFVVSLGLNLYFMLERMNERKRNQT